MTYLKLKLNFEMEMMMLDEWKKNDKKLRLKLKFESYKRYLLNLLNHKRDGLN
eukprot:CAMPEP_0182422876 /NCGR_PEP_ID=MMETSP1167-20130531/8700_1 /TAXON_ID=2988 /ORGANISM="Mallomonas Sp, Strain CCMP3275" /LENGTH=52 /DNA_ID=CAMNT_0024601317 /DNA_START=357 /DNA_END=515 /DNA_ORIENTATION=-